MAPPETSMLRSSVLRSRAMAAIFLWCSSIDEHSDGRMTGRRARCFWLDEQGSALLEGALVVPVLFTLVFGTLEFSHFFHQQHLVSTGLRDAARYLARTLDPSAGSAQTTAINLAVTGSAAGGSARRVTGFNPQHVTVTFSNVNNSLGVDGTRPYRS